MLFDIYLKKTAKLISHTEILELYETIPINEFHLKLLFTIAINGFHSEKIYFAHVSPSTG
jgi:hypothetical protein